MSHAKELPKVVDKSSEEIDKAIAAIEACDLPDETRSFAISCIRLAIWLPRALAEHKITLSNLRKLIFGRGRQRQTSTSGSDKKDSKDSENKGDIADQGVPSENKAANDKGTSAMGKNPAPGHGRIPHTAYKNTIEHESLVPDLKPGDACPLECDGKLYEAKPGIVVRVKGQNLAQVHKYWTQKLRCALCGHLVCAELPKNAGSEKYDAAFKAILTLQKYYVAIPFYRQACFQFMLGTPLPASTQWQLIEEVAGPAIPVFHALENTAADSGLIHNDDTHLKITEVISHNRANPNKERTGMFTTGILARSGERDIALFYNGTAHAGENLERLLKKRDAGKHAPIQMCDALSRNIPSALKTIICNCLSHGFRKFNDLKDFYPQACIHIMSLLASVYENDEETNDFSREDRLAYHKEHSTAIMDELYAYLNDQLDTKQVEPNDSLGKAMRYMLKHWFALTQFLRVAGAPLDNNILERTLKIPIRGRRTWLFYKTEYGAMIGGVLTSIIATCALSNINPLDYLIALQEHKDRVIKEPARWLPWNYQDNLLSTASPLAA